MKTQTRAKAGGQIGMNGERYEGGQFLPNTTLPKMSKQKPAWAVLKVEIAPRIYDVAPDGKRSIYKTFSYLWTWNFREEKFEICRSASANYFGQALLNKAAAAADLWNNGERWMDK